MLSLSTCTHKTVRGVPARRIASELQTSPLEGKPTAVRNAGGAGSNFPALSTLQTRERAPSASVVPVEGSGTYSRLVASPSQRAAENQQAQVLRDGRFS